MPRPKRETPYRKPKPTGNPVLTTRLDPRVRDFIRSQPDPRAYVEQLVRDDANERAIRNGQEPPFPPEDLPG